MHAAKRGGRGRPLKWSFLFYIPASVVVAYAGAYAIGIASNYLQGDRFNPFPEILSWEVWFHLAGDLQIVLIPLWAMFVFVMTGAVFYKRELEEPVKILMEAADQIADNRLDFSVACPEKNELGLLCDAFEKMRSALYRNNQEMWRQLEDRKNINAAFSHDMRTPITVLKGYRDLLEKYIPGGDVPEEKIMEILKRMGGQINRLENYTQKMSALQKLEDIIPQEKETDFGKLAAKCRETGELLSEGLQTVYTGIPEEDAQKVSVWVDEELLFEVYENMLSNAVRYAKSRLEIGIECSDGMFRISVEDDGGGFTAEALLQAVKPFYRGEAEEWEQDGKIHFGAGLFICKIICEKCRGTLLVENGTSGGRVTAAFGCEK